MSPDPAGRPVLRREETRAGLFVAVVGPSGAGKDTLIAHAARQLATEPSIRFARRVVTREVNEAAEDHDSLSRAEFDAAQARGAFCLTWNAHGLGYALPASVRTNVLAGCTVVANISRRSLTDAASQFGAIRIVEVTARPELLLARISARGRETPAEIAARLARQVDWAPPSATVDFVRVDNSDDLGRATQEFVHHLVALRSD